MTALEILLNSGITWIEKGYYLVTAIDGVVCSLGEVGQEKIINEYLAEFPDPTYW